MPGREREAETIRADECECEPCESPAERLRIISHLLRPGWLMLTSPLSLDGLGAWKFVAVWRRPS